MRKKIILYVALLGSIWWDGGRVFADKVESLHACVMQHAKDAMKTGFQLRMLDRKMLQEGQGTFYRVRFLRGHVYRIVACGEKNIKDLDVYLYNGAGVLLSQDKTKASLSTLSYTPASSGSFLFQVRAFRGRGSYVVGLLWRKK